MNVDDKRGKINNERKCWVVFFFYNYTHTHCYIRAVFYSFLFFFIIIIILFFTKKGQHTLFAFSHMAVNRAAPITPDTQPVHDGNAVPLFHLTVLCRRSDYRMSCHLVSEPERLAVTKPESMSVRVKGTCWHCRTGV